MYNRGKEVRMGIERRETTTKKGNTIIYDKHETQSTENAMCLRMVDIIAELRAEIDSLKSRREEKTSTGAGVYNININLPK